MSARFALEHDLWQQLKADELVGCRVLLAVSGGADSMALARAWSAVRPAHEIEWVHVHHGDGGNLVFRDEAEVFVRQQAQLMGVAVEVVRGSPRNQSEDELRRVRREAWQGLLKERKPGTLLVTAHHQQDLLETRMIRLLRGTGPQGFVSFGRRHGVLYRPFLRKNPTELRSYLQGRGQVWLEDPSNRHPGPLRNWIRHHWLPDLERKSPGAVRAMARSLDLLAEALPVQAEEVVAGASEGKPLQIPRLEYLGLVEKERRQRVVQCYRALGSRAISSQQIEEVKRHLDSSRKGHTFQVGEVLWSVNAQRIQAVRSKA